MSLSTEQQKNGLQKRGKAKLLQQSNPKRPADTGVIHRHGFLGRKFKNSIGNFCGKTMVKV